MYQILGSLLDVHELPGHGFSSVAKWIQRTPDISDNAWFGCAVGGVDRMKRK